MATKAVVSGATLSLKLLVDAKANRVVFAEASKDVVDFLFSLLALPVGTAVKLLGKDAMVGCVANLYGSVETLDGSYVQPGAAKDALLRPLVLSPAARSTNSSLLRLPPPSKGGLFKCNYGGYVTDTSGTACPCCLVSMTTPIQFVAGDKAAGSGGAAAKGFVQGIVTYTVMDDLTVTPVSSISAGIALLSTFAVNVDVRELQQKTVQVGYNEGLAILKASLQSRTVLTDVFLAKQQPTASRRLRVCV